VPFAAIVMSALITTAKLAAMLVLRPPQRTIKA
jgi:hypothetical protein